MIDNLPTKDLIPPFNNMHCSDERKKYLASMNVLAEASFSLEEYKKSEKIEYDGMIFQRPI